MKKKTRKLMENISKAIKYYYPFLNESEHAEMFDNFVYNALSEALNVNSDQASVQKPYSIADQVKVDALGQYAKEKGLNMADLQTPDGQNLKPGVSTQVKQFAKANKIAPVKAVNTW